jgi:septum site-determining protein MinD
MPGRVMVITSGKGGVGKTTAVANIGAGLALRGKRVVLVDADIGLRNLDVVLGLENRIVYDLVDVVEGTCRLKQALVKDKRIQELYLLPASQSRMKDAVRPEQMRALCEELRKDFDYVIVDSPAGIERGFQNAIAGADEAIVITTPDVAAVRDADRVIGLLEASSLSSHKLVINRVRMDMVRKGEMLDQEDVVEILAIELLGVVPEDEKVVISTNKGELVVTESGSAAGREFMRIARRIDGEEVPIEEEREGFMDWLKGIFGRRG